MPRRAAGRLRNPTRKRILRSGAAFLSATGGLLKPSRRPRPYVVR